MRMIEALAVQSHLASVGVGCAIGSNYIDNSVVIGTEVIFDYVEAKNKATKIVEEAKKKGLSKV